MLDRPKINKQINKANNNNNKSSVKPRSKASKPEIPLAYFRKKNDRKLVNLEEKLSAWVLIIFRLKIRLFRAI